MAYQPIRYTFTSTDCVLVNNQTTTEVRLKQPFLSFDFTYQTPADVVVKVDGVKTTNFTFENTSTIRLGETFNINHLPVTVSIERDSSSELTRFISGAAIRAEDLNKNFELLLNRIEELEV